MNAALLAGLVTSWAVLVDVGVNETFESIQLAQDSQQLFTGDDTVKQRLLRFAYIPGQGHEPNFFIVCVEARETHPTGPLPRWWQGIADIGCEAGKSAQPGMLNEGEKAHHQ